MLVLDIRRGDLEQFFREKGDEVVGVACEGGECPIRNYLADRCGWAMPMVMTDAVWDYDEYGNVLKEGFLPDFVQRFIVVLDETFGPSCLITGKQALAVLVKLPDERI